jgi:hypothetical protein
MAYSISGKRVSMAGANGAQPNAAANKKPANPSFVMATLSNL